MAIPHARDARYAEEDPRRTVEGCPFYDADMDWAQNDAAPRIGNALKAAAASRGVEVLELLHAFAGHEICAQTTSRSRCSRRRHRGLAEGSRGEREHDRTGKIQELFHPNAYGQKALGTCLGALYAARRGSYACTNAESDGPGDMMLTALR